MDITYIQTSRVSDDFLQAMTIVEKLMSQPISELDVSTWERCTTSYVKLPAEYPKYGCSGRTPNLVALLNDVCVSVTSGSEDYSFKVHILDSYSSSKAYNFCECSLDRD